MISLRGQGSTINFLFIGISCSYSPPCERSLQCESLAIVAAQTHPIKPRPFAWGQYRRPADDICGDLLQPLGGFLYQGQIGKFDNVEAHLGETEIAYKIDIAL